MDPTRGASIDSDVSGDSSGAEGSNAESEVTGPGAWCTLDRMSIPKHILEAVEEQMGGVTAGVTAHGVDARLNALSRMRVATKDLPDTIQSALRALNYHRHDIDVDTAERVSLHDAGSAGRRGFVALVDLASGETRVSRGSWGGANIANPDNPVDLDTSLHELPEGGAVIRGSEGGDRPVYATVTLNPRNVMPWLSAPAEELTDKERKILEAYGTLKAGEYRKQALREAKATEADIDALVSRGLLKKTGAGVQITTAGKNTRRSLGRW